MTQHIAYLEFLTINSSDVSKYLYGKELNPTQTVCLGIIERLCHSSKTLKELFDRIKAEPSHEYASGIIVRALMLDSLIGINLFKIFSDSEEAMDSDEIAFEKATQFCETILSDGFTNTFSYLEVIKEYGFIDEKQLNQAYSNTVKSNSYFFEPYNNDGAKPKLKFGSKVNSKLLFKDLANDKNMGKIIFIYDAYLYFSKYDHFGIMYYEIFRMNKEEKLKIYLQAFEGLIANMTFMFVILDKSFKSDKYIKEKAIQVNEYFQNIMKSQANSKMI